MWDSGSPDIKTVSESCTFLTEALTVVIFETMLQEDKADSYIPMETSTLESGKMTRLTVSALIIR